MISGELNGLKSLPQGSCRRCPTTGGHFLTAGVLTQLDYVVGAVTTRKTLFYNPDGSLHHITEASL